MKTIYEYTVKDINDQDYSLEDLKNKVILVVNVASKCGFTAQYTELEKIYRELKPQGFVILAFPCNQFGAQEPGNEEEIKNFCSLNYDVTFPLFKKIDVNGKNADPFIEFLKSSLPGLLGSKAIKWNFTKFLIDRNGKPTKRYAPNDSPLSLVNDIKELLKT